MRIKVTAGLLLAALVTSVAMASSAWATSYSVMSWGARGYFISQLGQLGNGREAGSSAPVAVPGLSGVSEISGGDDFALARLENGTIKSWGDNTFGQLGTGSPTGPESCAASRPCSVSPVTVSGLTGVQAVTTGHAFGLALLESGEVKAWGNNATGELGNGTNTGPETCEVASISAPCNATPTLVNGLSEVTEVSAGRGFALALLSNGKVMAWGQNEVGELGDGTTTSKYEPVEVQGLSGVVQIAAGYNEGLALLGNGKVMAWGGNVHAQLGTGEVTGPESCGEAPCSRTPIEVQGLSEVVEVGAGYWNEVARLGNGKVLTWGNNGYGALGIGNHTGPEFCPAAEVACSAVPLEVEGLGGTVVAVKINEISTVLARLSDGTVMTWGFNQAGQVGSGNPFGPDMKCGYGFAFEACDTTPGPVLGVSTAADAKGGGSFGLALVANPSPPEFGRCLAVEAETGEYDGQGCTETAGERKHEWYAGMAKRHFTLSGGEATFKTTGTGFVLHCNTESSQGEYSGQKTETWTAIHFHECTAPLFGTCSTAGAAAGEVVTSALTGTLGVEETSGEGPSANKLAVSLSPAGGTLFEATCGTTSFKVRGKVLVPVKANTMSLSPKLKFRATNGLQEPQKFEGGPTEVLETSVAGGAYVQTGLTLTVEQTNEEKVEVSSLA